MLRDKGNIAHVQLVASREQQLALWQPAASSPLAGHPLPALTVAYDVERSKAASGDLLVRTHDS